MHRFLTPVVLLACSKSPNASVADTASSNTPSEPPPIVDTADPEDTAEDDCTEDLPVTWDSWAQDFFHTWCDGCHAGSTPERNGAPEDYTFDTEAQVIEHRSILQWSVIEESRMPLGGGLPNDERTLLRYYLDCVLP